MQKEVCIDVDMLSQATVLPGNQDWPHYLELIVDYICENWPSVLCEDITKESFLKLYEQELVTRIEEGGRILLLWKLGNEPIAIANTWVEQRENETCLQIAEFSVIKKYRKRGFGRFIIKALMDVGKEANASRLIAEVDEDIEANYFWMKVLDNCIENQQSGRNQYWAYIK